MEYRPYVTQEIPQHWEMLARQVEVVEVIFINGNIPIMALVAGPILVEPPLPLMTLPETLPHQDGIAGRYNPVPRQNIQTQ